jgi:hypothetical protein
MFLASAHSSRIVLVGLSMADANIRRWLGWTHATRLEEIARRGSAVPFSSQHLWITTPSSDPHVQAAKETGLLHLGVRTAFIPAWTDLEAAMTNLLGL